MSEPGLPSCSKLSDETPVRLSGRKDCGKSTELRIDCVVSMRARRPVQEWDTLLCSSLWISCPVCLQPSQMPL